MPTEPEFAPPDRVGELSPAARLLLCALFLLLADLLCPAIGTVVLRSSGVYDWFYGAEAVEQAQNGLSVRLGLWLYPVTLPLWVAGVFLFLRVTRVVPPAVVGLTLRQAIPNCVRGLAAATVLIPAVMGLNLGAIWLFQTLLGLPPQEHPFSTIGQQGLHPVEWWLLAVAVMVSAPIREELMFRGVLPRLFAATPWGSHVAMGMAAAVALARQPQTSGTFNSGPLAAVTASLPVLFVVAMVPVYVVVWWRSATTATPALFATALFFGAIHSFAWPTPIALFVLALGLGYLTMRTRSLVAAVVVHSLFNGVSFVLLLNGYG